MAIFLVPFRDSPSGWATPADLRLPNSFSAKTVPLLPVSFPKHVDRFEMVLTEKSCRTGRIFVFLLNEKHSTKNKEFNTNLSKFFAKTCGLSFRFDEVCSFRKLVVSGRRCSLCSKAGRLINTFRIVSQSSSNGVSRCAADLKAYLIVPSAILICYQIHRIRTPKCFSLWVTQIPIRVLESLVEMEKESTVQ